MKIYTKIALILCSLSAPIFANEDDIIVLVKHFTSSVGRFKDAMDDICINGHKDGITALHELRKDLAQHQPTLFDTEVGVAMTTIYRKFNMLLAKICTTLQFEPGKTLTDITIDLTKNFDVKTLFPEMISDLQQLQKIAQQHEYEKLVAILDDLIGQVHTEQKKWNNTSATMFAKLVQSIKAFLHMHR